MNTVLEQMLSRYSDSSNLVKKYAIKEIIQEMVLCGLSRGGFFTEASFYGGTALRIFYGLDRFSEDLDFSLKTPNHDFDLFRYFSYVERELNSYGLQVEITEKKKTTKSQIKSAFIKGDSKQHILTFYGSSEADKITAGEKIKIKMEVDTDPPEFANFEHKFRLLPSPYELSLYDAPSLFAGKIHAVLCRAWKDRVKGRDLYDYVFYLARSTPINLNHLRARLTQTGFIKLDDRFTPNDLQEALHQKFRKIDFKQAAEDVLPFINDPSSVQLWSKEFFAQITDDYFART